jgi:hypothetical protein
MITGILSVISGFRSFDRIDPDGKVSGPDLSDSCNSDDCQASKNVGGDDGGNDGASGGCSCGYNDEDDDNEWGSLGRK